eukprot:2504204-Rhodomonas_salina.2
MVPSMKSVLSGKTDGTGHAISTIDKKVVVEHQALLPKVFVAPGSTIPAQYTTARSTIPALSTPQREAEGGWSRARA